ncbi:MAG: glycosyltransferase involved in cell wall biosynthesis [Verrucomicrobiales bacterium]|jgi:glycosyltransferase involved in cell wall biosynthesis
MSPGRIGVNLLWLRPGQVGGTETYIRRVLRAVSVSDSNIEWHLFGTDAAIRAARPDDSNCVVHESGSLTTSRARRVVAERTWLKSELGSNLDVVHHPGGTVPFASETPTILTLHDLQPLELPGNFSRVKRQFLRRAIPTAVERADVVATPSDWVREQVIDRFGISGDRVITVSAFAEPVDLSLDPRPTSGLQQLFAQGPVIFYPAMTMAHKNHRLLFDAFGDAVRREPDLQLICVGAVGRDDADIRAHADSVSSRIHVLGHVARRDLDALFLRSELMVFPSRYEGFGLPILEAQHAGLPVVASNATALPEVAGSSTILLDPDDRDAWSTAMLDRPGVEERARHVADGFTNARRYGPEHTAEQQLRAYERLTS